MRWLKVYQRAQEGALQEPPAVVHLRRTAAHSGSTVHVERYGVSVAKELESEFKLLSHSVAVQRILMACSTAFWLCILHMRHS
jgi:hypothetical protein